MPIEGKNVCWSITSSRGKHPRHAPHYLGQKRREFEWRERLLSALRRHLTSHLRRDFNPLYRSGGASQYCTFSMKKYLNAKRSRLRNVFKAPAVAPTERPTDIFGKVPEFVANYQQTLNTALRLHDWSDVKLLAETLQRCWRENRNVFLCGNGGSAANAIHLANDFLYGIDKRTGRGLRVTALPANAAVLTALANDVSYEDVFAQQLTVMGNRGDVLIVFSGSGNSPNVVKALKRAQELGMISFAILGFSGGKCLALANHPIYFPVNDMQVSEDLQMMVGHMVMQWLSQNRP